MIIYYLIILSALILIYSVLALLSKDAHSLSTTLSSTLSNGLYNSPTSNPNNTQSSRAINQKILIFNQINSLCALFIAGLATISTYKAYLDIAILYSFFSFASSKALIYYQNNRSR